MHESNNYFPLFIDFSDKTVVVFGGGKVAERKVIKFLAYAKVTVISQSFTHVLLEQKQNNNLELHQHNLQELTDDKITHFLASSFLVIPATSDKTLNKRIGSLAKSSNVLVNYIDDIGEVIIPSIINQGDLTVAISSQGKSPALSKFTRKKLQDVITPDYAAMSRLQAEMRARLKTSIPEQGKRKIILSLILNSEEIWNELSVSYDNALHLAQELATS